MDRLFTPWRSDYIQGRVKAGGCILCDARDSAAQPGSLVIGAGAACFALMNLYPYTSGHVMVAPMRHVASLGEATAAELGEMMEFARRLEAVLAEAYHPDGMNVGMNLGRAAGAGVADHIHLHLVPRWSGDANFMTVTGGTRVIPEDPRAAAERLRALLGSRP